MPRNYNRLVISALVLGIIMTLGTLGTTIYQLNTMTDQIQPETNSDGAINSQLLDLLVDARRNDGTGGNASQLLDLLVDARRNHGTGDNTSQLLDLLVDARLNNGTGGNTSQLLDLLVDARLTERTGGDANAEEAAAPVGNVAQAASPAPASVAPTLPAPAVDYTFSYMVERAECTTATQIVAQLLESWGYRIRLDQVSTPEELFRQLSAAVATEQRTHLTLCYSDPEDRGHFTANLNQISIIGNGYYDDGVKKLYMVSQEGLAAQMDEHDNCLFAFFQNFNDQPIALQGQSATDFLFDNQAEAQAWGNCFGHKGETKAEHKAHE